MGPIRCRRQRDRFLLRPFRSFFTCKLFHELHLYLLDLHQPLPLIMGEPMSFSGSTSTFSFF